MADTLPKDRTTPLYKWVADEIENSIRHGVYEPGERLPSIRNLSTRFGVSLNTVREAYSYLETRRVVGARSQSGHYVLYAPTADPEPAFEDTTTLDPQAVTIDDLTYEIAADCGVSRPADLSTATPPVDVLPVERLTVLSGRVAREKPHAAIEYDTSPGNYELRQNISKRLFEAGVSLSADNIVLTAGCLEAVMLSLLATCRPGDTILVESPTFFLFYQLFQRLGLKVIEVPSSPQEGIDLGVVEFALTHYTVNACLVIPNFSNPNGALMPDHRKQALAELLSRHRVALIEDDIYGELYFGAKRPSAVGAFSDRLDWYLCSSFSKTLAPGYRLGWVATRPENASQVARLKMTTSIGVSSLSVLVAARFMETGGFDRHLRRMRRTYEKRMVSSHELIRHSFPSGTRLTSPHGGMVLWVQLPAAADSIVLFQRAKAEGIGFAPGPIFSLSHQFSDYLRITAVNWSAETETALLRLGELAHELLA